MPPELLQSVRSRTGRYGDLFLIRSIWFWLICRIRSRVIPKFCPMASSVCPPCPSHPISLTVKFRLRAFGSNAKSSNNSLSSGNRRAACKLEKSSSSRCVNELWAHWESHPIKNRLANLLKEYCLESAELVMPSRNVGHRFPMLATSLMRDIFCAAAKTAGVAAYASVICDSSDDNKSTTDFSPKPDILH